MKTVTCQGQGQSDIIYFNPSVKLDLAMAVPYKSKIQEANKNSCTETQLKDTQ